MYVIQIKTEKDTSYAVWTSSLGKRYLAPTSKTPNDAAQWKTYSGVLNALKKNRDSLSKKGEVSIIEANADDFKCDYFNVGDQVIVAQIEVTQIVNFHRDTIDRRTSSGFAIGKSAYKIVNQSSLPFPYAYSLTGQDFAFVNEEDLDKFRLKLSVENLVKQIEKLEYSRQLEDDLKRIIEKYKEN